MGGHLPSRDSCRRPGAARRWSDHSPCSLQPLVQAQGDYVLMPQRPPRCRRPAFKECHWPSVLPYLPSSRRTRGMWQRHGSSEPSAPHPGIPAAVEQGRCASRRLVGRNAWAEAVHGRICVSADADSITRIPWWPPSVRVRPHWRVMPLPPTPVAAP